MIFGVPFFLNKIMEVELLCNARMLEQFTQLVTKSNNLLYI